MEDPENILTDLIHRAHNYGKTNPSPSKKKSKRKRKRMTEKEGDEEMMNSYGQVRKFVKLTKQPRNIKNGEMRPYQIQGLNWMVNLRLRKISGIIADEMGLGKTLQVISLLAYVRITDSIEGPHLVVIPKSTIPGWQKEFKKWCPDVNVCVLDGDKDSRKIIVQKRIKPIDFDVVICSYDICMREKASLKKIDFEYIVVDEAHRLKNHMCKLANVLRTYKSQFRLLMTGTPIQNNLRELWALLNFLLPDVFNDLEAFDSIFNFADGITDEKRAELFNKLRQLLQPFLLRRLKKTVAKDIPPKTESILFVGMSAVQKKVYKHILMRDFASLLEKNGAKSASSRSLLNLVMQCRKAANHPYLFDGIEDRSLDEFGEHLIENSGKLHLLDKLVKRFREKGNKILIFSQMTRMLDILEDFCTMRGHDFCRLDGSTSTEERIAQMDLFNDRESSYGIFLLSTRAGGLGINLQTANVVILYDSDWNPQMDLQAIDRAHRIGQTQEVLVYRLITEHSVEQKMIERAEMKLRLDAMVIQKGHQATSKKVSKSEMLEMVNYGADHIFKSGDSSITDEDIDSILEAGKKRTEELTGKWEKATQKKFSEFTFDGNYQVLDGIDYSNAKMLKQRKENLLEVYHEGLGKRNRTRIKSYSVEQYYANMLRLSSGPNVNGLKKPANLPDFKAWQFFNEDRLYDIWNKEYDFFIDNRSNKQYTEDMEPLTKKEKAEKKKLLEEGFPLTYRQFLFFVRDCCRLGMDSEEIPVNLSKEFPELDLELCQRYQKAFFERSGDEPGLETHLSRIQEAEDKRTRKLDRIEKAEAKKKDREERQKRNAEKRAEVQKRREKREAEKKEREAKQLTRLRDALTSVHEQYKEKPSFQHIKIPAPNQAEGFSTYEDKFLVLQSHRLGLVDSNEWGKLYDVVHKDARFMFNHFMLSRTANQLKDRTLRLTRAVASRNAHKKRKLENPESAQKNKKVKVEATENPKKINGCPPTAKKAGKVKKEEET